MKNISIMGLVTARGGSKGLPKKNILPLCAHPLISYSIQAGLDSKLIQRVILSTDCLEISKIGKSYGAETPFLRPLDFAQDHSTDIEVFDHCINWLKNNENYQPDLIVHLRPTSPIRFGEDIDKAIQILLENDSIDSVRSVCKAPITPYKMWKIGPSGELKPLLTVDGIKEPYNSPRQKLPDVFWQTGTFDITRSHTIIEKRSMTGDKIFPFIIDQQYAIDIDDMSSFVKAEEIIMRCDCVKPSKKVSKL